MDNPVTHFEIATDIKAPKVIRVVLVRADLLDVAGVFRTAWDVSLAATMMVAGSMLDSASAVTLDRRLLFGACAIVAVASRIADAVFTSRARTEAT